MCARAMSLEIWFFFFFGGGGRGARARAMRHEGGKGWVGLALRVVCGHGHGRFRGQCVEEDITKNDAGFGFSCGLVFGGRRFENEWAVAEIDDDDDDDSLCARADEARRVRANCALHLLCPRIFGVQNIIDELREEKRDVCLCTISRRQVMRGRRTSSMLHERK